MRRLICLFGGTFDPVHYGHLKPLDELQQYLAADAVHVLPASVPPHRPAPLASSEQRLNMLQLALREYPGFILDSRELERSGPSWTVLTLQSFRQQYPDASLCLVMGSDAFNGLTSWYHWQQIPQLANIIVIERAGMETATRPDWATEHLVRDVDSLREQQVFQYSVCQPERSMTYQQLRSGSEWLRSWMLPACCLIKSLTTFVETGFIRRKN